MTDRARCDGIGMCLPDRRVSNDELGPAIGGVPACIEAPTGMRDRPVLDDADAVSDLAIRAGIAACDDASIDASTCRLVLLATSTPDHLLPPTAPVVARGIGAMNAGAIDLAGACSGFLYGMALAASHVIVTSAPAIVIGANILSRRVNPDDPATACIFADGAGAVVLTPTTDDAGVLATTLRADGAHADALLIPAGGSRQPVTADAIARHEHLMHLHDGGRVFRHAVRGMRDAGRHALHEAGMSVDDVTWWVPHQANRRIIEETGRQLGVAPERTVCTVEQFGNSSAATIPTALSVQASAGRLQRGDIVLMTAAGAGFTSAAVVVRW